MQPQSQDNWCWAANSASISIFYDAASTWTQCSIACQALANANCCLNPTLCNVAWYLERALTITGNFSGAVIPGQLDANAITAQIDQGKIIGVRIGWSGGGGHFVSIYGYNQAPTDFFVAIGDPIYGDSTINLNNFTNNYQGSGSWTHSYNTKSNLLGMLQFTTIHENIIKEATLLKESFGPSSLISEPGLKTQVPVSTPHDIYTVSLQSLKEGRPDIRKGGFRVVDQAGVKGRQMYDFSDSTKEAKVQQVIHSNTFSEKYEHILEDVLQKQKSIRQHFTLRTIRQPELKIEAFWLHDASQPGADIFEPVLTTAFLEAGQTYTKQNFFYLLESAARNRVSYQDDLLGG